MGLQIQRRSRDGEGRRRASSSSRASTSSELPENVACPPGCAECCSGYEPFVNKADVQRIADHFGMTLRRSDERVHRRAPVGRRLHVGWLRKVTEELADKCVFLKGSRSGRYYCGIYEARPHDCGAFTPIGCDDVDRVAAAQDRLEDRRAVPPKRRSAKRNGKRR